MVLKGRKHYVRTLPRPAAPRFSLSALPRSFTWRPLYPPVLATRHTVTYRSILDALATYTLCMYRCVSLPPLLSTAHFRLFFHRHRPAPSTLNMGDSDHLTRSADTTEASRVFSVFSDPATTRSTVIVGAGIIGCATAYYLAHSGNTKPDTIHLVEASPELFASASGKGAGFLASDCK